MRTPRTISKRAAKVAVAGSLTALAVMYSAQHRAMAITPGGSSGIAGYQGFDGCQGTAQPTVSQMLAFWNGTPYWEFYLYIGGSYALCGPGGVNASWVDQVTNQGWALVPLWVGPQAPCGVGGISYDTNTANSQGKTEADSAVSAAQSLGFAAGSIIYYDMEQYDTTNSGCVAAVNAFVNGWDYELNHGGWTPGVYSSGAAVSHYWTYDERHHQFTGSHNETWNGVTLNIDNDCANGRVAATSVDDSDAGVQEGGSNDPVEDPHCN